MAIAIVFIKLQDILLTYGSMLIDKKFTNIYKLI